MTDLRITRYSHYFSVFGYTVKGRMARRAFSERFIEMELTKKRGRFVKEAKKIYARRNLKTEETSFHISSYDDFILELKSQGIRESDIEVITVPVYQGDKVEFRSDITPWENQVPIIDFAINENSINVVTAQAGFGKAATLSSKIRVPGGWLTMGDMTVGQHVVAKDGSISKVIGVYPQGVTEVWRVHFADGRYTDVNPEHLWSVREEGEEVESILSTRDIKGRLGFTKPRLSIPLFEGESTAEKAYGVDPYIFGLTLAESTDSVAIPEEYLEGSAEQRSALLLGLLGISKVIPDLTLSFCNESRALTESVQYLVRSLGGIALFVTHKPDSDEKELHQLFIRLRNKSLRLNITRIEERSPEPTQCIMIDHPEHLYVTDDFIVTHNTTVSLAAAVGISERFAVMTLGGYEDRWIPEFYEKLGLRPEEVRSCCGCTKLYRLIREVKEYGIGEIKAIFISTRTMLDFIKNWNSGKVAGSGCEDVSPDTLWEFLGLGLLIVDEAHKEIHLQMLVALHTHINKVIYLTATLFPNTEFTSFIYETMYPSRFRMNGGSINKYVECVRVLYNLKDPQKARFVGGQGSYSHTTYEQWIMSDAKRENNYLESIYNYTLSNWLVDREEQHKLLIFAATIELCQKLCAYFTKRAPDLIHSSYTSGDDYQILIDSHIIFSTIGKSGTAVDIPDLTQAYLTTAIDSKNANIQALGRLRELKGDKKFPQSYHVFVCLNIDKHLDYWNNKETLFKNRITGVRTAYLDRAI